MDDLIRNAVKYVVEDAVRNSVDDSIWNRMTKNVHLKARVYTRNAVGDTIWIDVKDSVYNFVAEYFHKRTLI